MVEIKYDDLPDRLQVGIDEMTISPDKNIPENPTTTSSAQASAESRQFENVLKRLNSHYSTDFDPSELHGYIENRRTISNRRAEIFHPKKGILSLFNYHGELVKSQSWGQGQAQQIENAISSLIDNRDADTLKPTQALKEDTEKLNRLKLLVNNTPLTGQTEKPFNDEELNLVKIMIRQLSAGVVKEPKSFEYKSVDEMKKVLSTFEHISSEDRQAYYAYWKSVSAKFEDFYKSIFTFNRESEEWGKSKEEDSKRMARSLKRRKDFDKLPQARKDLINTYADAKVKYEGSHYEVPLELPNYIMELSPMPVKAMSDEDKILELVNSYLSTIPGHIRAEHLKEFDKKVPESGQKLHAVRGEIQESTESEGARTSIPDLVETIEDTKERLSKWVESEELDPIFAMSTYIDSEKLKTNYTENVLEGAKKELTLYIKTGKGALADEIAEFMKDNINKFIDNYAKVGHVPPIESVYYIPILDDDRHVNAFNALIKNFQNYQIAIDYITQGGVPNTKTFNDYGEAVDWVNKRTITFFNNLNKVLKAKETKYGLTGKAPPTTRALSHGIYWEGGQRKASRSKLAKADKELFEANREMDENIKEYYIEPMTNNQYLINRDRPDFYSDKSFRTYLEISASDPIQVVLNDIIKRGTPLDISKHTLNSITSLITEINKGNKQALWTEGEKGKKIELKKVYTKAVNGMMRIFTSLPRDKKLELRRALHIAFGDMLYEVGMAHHQGDKKLVGQIDWKGKPLSYWNKQESQTGQNIPYIAELMLRPEWEEMIGKIHEKEPKGGIWAAHKTLVNSIWKLSSTIQLSDMTNAMLYTKDLLLKMKGEPQYIATMDLYNVDDISFVADLIQKEDRLDIYATDIEKIVKYQGAFKTVADSMGVDEHIVYKIKGMFRGY